MAGNPPNAQSQHAPPLDEPSAARAPAEPAPSLSAGVQPSSDNHTYACGSTASKAADASPTITIDLGPARSSGVDNLVADVLHTLRRVTEHISGATDIFLREDAQALPPEVLAILSALDDRLVEALERGDILFVRAAWLLAQPAEFRMVWRQKLEE
jgi:hypothetical protein